MEKSRVFENNNIDANARKRSAPCKMVCNKKIRESEKRADKSLREKSLILPKRFYKSIGDDDLKASKS